MKNRIVSKLTVILVVVLLSAASIQAQTIQFSISSATAKRGDTLLLPLNVNALNAGHGVISGQMVFSYNSSVIDIYGIQTNGAVLQNVLEVQYNIANRRLAFSDTGAVTGSGVFAYLRVRVVANPSPLNDSIKIQSVMLNEGSPTASWTNGYIRVLDMHITPQNPPTNLIVGDSLQFSVTGDNLLPLTWTSSNPSAATIDASGKMRAIGVGQLKIHVADSQGLQDSSVLFGINSPLLRSLTISLRDTSFTQTLQFAMPVYITDVTPLGLISARFALTYNTTHLQAMDIITAGTLSESWSSPAFTVTSGRVDVALAGTEPLIGSGVLAYVKFRVGATATSYTDINFSNVLFNEDVNANIDGGRFTALPAPALVVLPNSTTLAIGDSMLFRVTSGGTPPYQWTTSNPAVASIHPTNGWLKALERGTTTVTVVDSFGFTKTTGLVTVEDIRAKLPDTSIVVIGDSVDVPVTFFGAPGLGVISFETRITYNSSIVQLMNVYGEGTLCESFNITFRDTLDTVRIAAAGTEPVSGEGELLILRFRTAPGATVGQNTLLRFTQFLLNEPGSGTPTVRTHNGRVFVGVSDPSQYLMFTPPSLTFGNINVGEDASLSVKTKNLAIEAMSINTAFSNHPDFSVAPSLGWLEPDDSANYSVTFTPSSPGLKNGYIIFTHSADGSPDSLPVSGIGVAPEISIAPLTLDFKSVQLGVSKTENVIVTNTGTSDLGITNVQSDNGDFVILPTGAIIAPSQSDTFAITFTPAALGIVTGEISFTHNASGSPSTVEVSGTGIATAFAVAPGNISFGDVLLGGSKTDSVTAYNLGSANLVISSALADNALFLVAPGNITIPPYDSAQFYVTFSASSYGEQSGNVIFNHNANGTPDSVLLSSRTVAPLFSLSASSLNFQDVVYGSSKTDSVVVTNSGTAELTITGVQSNESDFAVSPASISLLPSESETFLVTFTPSSIGAIEGAGIFVHNAGSSPDTLRLSGTGIYGIVEVPISSRWNLISLPVVPLNDSLRAMFPNSIQPYAYSYDGTTYLQQETMQKGTGYWVKFPAAETASVQGYPFYRDTVTVHAGWNLIGATSQPLAALSVEPLGTELESQLWGFRSGYYNADTLYPGNGYWVKTTQTGSLILNPLSVKQRSSPEISEINVEQFLNKLIIVNGTGEKVMLYYGEPTEGTSQNRTWELPPLPPIGIFDARFVTGTYVELNSETQERVIPLSFSSVQLPLTVRWEIRENKSHHASLRVEGRTIELNNDGEVIITDLTSTVSLVLDKRAIIPQEYALQQNYPNPFNPSTVFSFQFPVSCWVTLKIYNVLGEEMATLIDGMQDAGYRMQSFDASGLPSGVYYYRMTAGSFSETKRMVLMR